MLETGRSLSDSKVRACDNRRSLTASATVHLYISRKPCVSLALPSPDRRAISATVKGSLQLSLTSWCAAATRLASISLSVVLPWNSTIRCSSRSEEHTSELQSLMRISYAVFCLKKKTQPHTHI